MLEIQQNVDLTYRLYDYGRARPLQLDESIKAAVPEPFVHRPALTLGPGREELIAAPKFAIERLAAPYDHHIAANPSNPVWLMPIASGCTVGNTDLAPVSYTHLDVYKRQARDCPRAALARRWRRLQRRPEPSRYRLLKQEI